MDVQVPRVRQEPIAAMDVFTAFSGRNNPCRLVDYSMIVVKHVALILTPFDFHLVWPFNSAKSDKEHLHNEEDPYSDGRRAAGFQPKSGCRCQTLRLAYETDPVSLDPHEQLPAACYSCPTCCSTLWCAGTKEMQFDGRLAHQLERLDRFTVRFHLRQGSIP